MRLSFIFELLLIFVFLAFAASRVIDTKASHQLHTKSLSKKRTKIGHKVRQDDTINRYCSCNTKLCNCCREFDIPVVALKGPGCASLQYLNGDKLAISMSFGDRVLTNTTINSRRPRPICMPLPGGVSKFCGRVYNIARQGQDFNACLGLELKALKDVEAALRVSCFRFGSQGLKVLPAQPLPPVDGGNEDDDDDDDDDYDDEDDFGFDDDDDDDDEEEEDDDNDVESTDYESFSLLDDDFIGGLFTSEGDDGEGAPIKKVTTTTKAPLRKVTRKPLRKVTNKPLNTRRVTKKPSVTTATTSRATEAPVTTAAIPTESITTSATIVESEKDPEIIIPITNVSINEIPDTAVENIPIPEHDSIPIVTSMLEVPEPVNVSSIPITKIDFADVVTSTEVHTETTIMQEPETTPDEKVGTTEEIVADEDEEENDEPVQSLIIKDDDDEEEEEEDEDSEESDPISEAVEDVLGVEDEKKEKKKDEATSDKLTDDEKGGKDEESVESKDVVDDIIDGTVDMISLTDDSEEEPTKTKTNKEESDEDDDLLDDDDDEDDDEDDDDDDDDEDEARKARTKNFRQIGKEGRKSRDMWLDRLHW